MEKPEVSTHILETWEDIVDFKNFIIKETIDYLALDLETDSTVEVKANIYGIGLSITPYEAFYIPIRRKTGDLWWDSSQEDKIKSLIRFLCLKNKVIGHNIVYDASVLSHYWNLNIIDSIYSDTILQKHILDEDRPFGLKEVAVKYLGSWADKAQSDLYDNIKANGGTTTKDNLQMFKADTHILGTYCAWDVLLTRMLFDIFEPRIKSEGLYDLFYKDEIMPLYKEVTIPMKLRGFPIDVQYFEKLNNDISKEIRTLETQIQQEIKDLVEAFCFKKLNEDYQIKKTGKYPKMLAEYLKIPLPLIDGKVSLSKKALQLQNPQNDLTLWLQDKKNISSDILTNVQRYWYFQENTDTDYIFNLKSNNHLKYLFFEVLKLTPLSYTETKEPQVDDDFLESIKANYNWIKLLIDYKKLNKLKSTYIEGILEKQVNGIIYTSMLQFGTTSGRFSSSSPNLQNLPRVKEEDSGLSETVLKYVNSIRTGFIAPKGYKIVDADYSQLEPRAFAEASNEFLLQKVFLDKEDLYGSIAKRIWNLDCEANEVKKKYPELRQKSKAFSLACVYGAEAGRISQVMGISYEEAQDIINMYFDAYPRLKNYMEKCNEQVCKNGFVKTKFGRIRHLPEGKELFRKYGNRLLNKKWAKENGLDDIRWKFKNILNLAKNFPIQGVAAHVVNRSAINISKEFKQNNIDGYIALQIHDQLICIVKENQSELALDIIKNKMENSIKLTVPLIAEPKIANNMKDSH